MMPLSPSTWACSKRTSNRKRGFETAMTTLWNKYSATAARKHGKPGRDIRPKSTTIDIHSHVGIPAAAAYAKPHLDMETIPLFNFADPETRALNQKQEEDIR